MFNWGNMWGDHIHIKYRENRSKMITFERSSKNYFSKFFNLSNMITRTILIFCVTLLIFQCGFKLICGEIIYTLNIEKIDPK